MMSQFSSVWNFSGSAICLNNWIKFVNILIYNFDRSWKRFAFHEDSLTVRFYFQKTNSSQTFILKSCTDNSNSSATLFNIQYSISGSRNVFSSEWSQTGCWVTSSAISGSGESARRRGLSRRWSRSWRRLLRYSQRSRGSNKPRPWRQVSKMMEC